jgi:hypothetical protein
MEEILNIGKKEDSSSSKKMIKVQDAIMESASKKPVKIYAIMQMLVIALVFGVIIYAVVDNYSLMGMIDRFDIFILVMFAFLVLAVLSVPLGFVLIGYGGHIQSKKWLQKGLTLIYVFLLIVFGIAIIGLALSLPSFIFLLFSSFQNVLQFSVMFSIFIINYFAIYYAYYLIGSLRDYFVKPSYKMCRKPKIDKMIIFAISVTVLSLVISQPEILYTDKVVLNANTLKFLTFQLPLFDWIITLLSIGFSVYSIYMLFFLKETMKDIEFNESVVEDYNEEAALSKEQKESNEKPAHQRKTLDDL